MVLFLKYKIWQGTDWGVGSGKHMLSSQASENPFTECVTVWCLVLKFHLLSLLLSFYCPNYCGRWKENINCRHKYKYKQNYLLIKQMNTLLINRTTGVEISWCISSSSQGITHRANNTNLEMKGLLSCYLVTPASSRVRDVSNLAEVSSLLLSFTACQE